MVRIIKDVFQQDADYKVAPRNSHETSINLSSEIASFLGAVPGNRNITFIINRSNLLVSACGLLRLMPLYKNLIPVDFSTEVVLRLIKEIEDYFGSSEEKEYSVSLLLRNDGRCYLNGLTAGGFNIRHFLVELYSRIEFVKNEGEGIRLNLILSKRVDDTYFITAAQRRLLFIEYINSQNNPGNTVKQYPENIDNLNAMWGEATTVFKEGSIDNYWQLTDRMRLDSAYQFLKQYAPGHASEFESPAKATNNHYSAAVLKYRSFLDSDFYKNHVKKGLRSMNNSYSLQSITYGAPGTGKSHKISAVANENNSIRVTFHPDTDYSAFIGAYKPTMVDVRRTYVNEGVEKDVVDGDGNPVVEKKIVYSFVPQAFMKAYVEAWRRRCDGNMPDGDKVFYLVIEEINRGNCAQIFGDAFQLLDRCANGFSSYAIAPDHDVERFLREDKDWNLSELALTGDVTNDEGKVVATAAQIKRGERMVLPPNLCIWATMNTSDQSLFPMDSAFKRRWDWEYMPIKDENEGYKIKVGTDEYEWWSFVNQINDVIADDSEDKQLGYFFARPKDGGNVIDADDFVSKVIFYLWKDVFKDDLPQTKPFKYKFKEDDPEDGVEILFTHFYKDGLKDKLVKHFLDELGVKKVEAQDGQPAISDGATEPTAAPEATAETTTDPEGTAEIESAAVDGTATDGVEG